jgi:hypothetical protein
MRENRAGDCTLKSSKELKKQDRGTFDYQYGRNGEVLFVRWNNDICVTIGINFDIIDPLAAVTRWNRGISQPRVLKTYRSHMGSVNHHDWLVGKYAIDVRGKKWHWALFTCMIDVTLVNAWLLYRRMHWTF